MPSSRLWDRQSRRPGSIVWLGAWAQARTLRRNTVSSPVVSRTANWACGIQALSFKDRVIRCWRETLRTRVPFADWTSTLCRPTSCRRGPTTERCDFFSVSFGQTLWNDDEDDEEDTHFLFLLSLCWQIFIWDLTNPNKPYSPATRSTKLEDVTCVAWNRQVAHILASASNNGYTVIWDLRNRRELIQLAHPGGRKGITSISWNPDLVRSLLR